MEKSTMYQKNILNHNFLYFRFYGGMIIKNVVIKDIFLVQVDFFGT